MASPNKFLCHLSKSPLFDIFLYLLRPSVSGHGRLPPVLGRSSGLCFPPFAIIPRVLAKLRESRGTELTLVAPHWAQRPWFPDLLQLSLALQWSSPTASTSCSSLGLGSATRVSTGCGFMPGDSPAIHQSSGFLVGSSCAGFLGASSVIARQLPAQVDSLQILVPLSWSFGVSSFPCEGGRFSVQVAVCQRPSCLFHQRLLLNAVCGLQISPPVLVLRPCSA